MYMGLGPSDGTWSPRSPDLVKEPGTPNAFVLQADCPKQEDEDACLWLGTAAWCNTAFKATV